MEDRTPSRGRTARVLLAPLLLYLSLALLLTAEAWGSPTTRWIGRCCDPEQTMWFLRWVPASIEQGLNPFLTDRLNAPAGVNLMWNTMAPLVGLVMTPVTLLGGPILAYNVAIVASLGLSAWAAYLALRRYAGGVLGPVIGGMVYGFSPYMASHAVLHLQLVAAWSPPLFLLLLDELLIRRRHGPLVLGAALGVVAGLQVLTFEEILATSAVMAAVLAAVLALVARNRTATAEAGRRVAIAAPPAVGAFLVLAGWPLGVQFLGPQRIGTRIQDTATFSTDLLNLVLPTRYQLFTPEAAARISDKFSGLFHEATGYLGLPLLIVLVAAVAVWWTDLRIRVAGIMAGIALVLSMGPELNIGGVSTGWPLPWQPLGSLPLIEHALPGRLTLFAWLAVAAVLAIVVAEVTARRRAVAIPLLATLAVAVALAAPAPIGSSTAAVPEFFRSWDRQGISDDAVILVAPYFTNGAGADPMLWAAVAGDRPRMWEAYAYVPGPDGSPSYGPPPNQVSRIMAAIQDDGAAVVARGQVRDLVLQDLATAGITDVIVGPMPNRQQMVAFFTDLFGRPPIEVDGVQLWRNVNGPA